MSSETLHAPRDALAVETLTHHHAIVSLKEELEAADWYRQRADDCADEALKAILLHNMREEIEHACMILEWLRRHDGEWARQIAAYLYSEGAITEVEEAETGGSGGGPPPGEGTEGPAGTNAGAPFRFTIGSLKGKGGQ